MPILAATLLSLSLLAQEQSSITGKVIDGGSGRGLAGASVAVEAAGDVTVVRPAGASVFMSSGISTATRDDGSYRLSGLAAGTYRLHVRLLGYREAVIEVEVTRTTAFEVSIGLITNPIKLEPLDVEAASQPYGRTQTALQEAKFGRVGAEVFRGQQFIAGDAHVLTQSEVNEAVTLGEGDLLRALQRLPGVSARDDYTAGLWTRGAPWGQTRAYYDGLPLFNPVHAFGLLSSMNPDAVGLASFHPGVRSAAVGEGAAGVLSLTSRAADRPGLHGLSELSVTSARATLDGRTRDGSRGFVVGARRSYVDAATRLAQIAGGDSAVYLPYAFLDLNVRGDLRLSDRTAVEVSGLWAKDNVHGVLRQLLQNTRGWWGNQLAQASLSHEGERLRSRVWGGVTRFSGVINPPAASNRDGMASTDVSQQCEDSSGVCDDGPPPRPAPLHGSTSNSLTVVTGGFDLGQGGVKRSGWKGGIQIAAYWQSFSGQYPRPYPVAPLQDQLFLDESVIIPAYWGERRWTLGPVTLETGIRAEMPSKIANAPNVAVAPRLSARFTPAGAGVSVSAGLARSWQYTQALAPAGPSVGPDLYLTDVWLLASDTLPAIRADIGTVGVEFAPGSGWIAAANGYSRWSTGVAVPDPRPGQLTGLFSTRRDITVPAQSHAIGLELGLRRIVGRVTASLSYTLARSRLQARGWRFFSPADRRHAVDGTVLFRLSPSVRLGAAFTAATGAPFSRFTLQQSPVITVAGLDTTVTDSIRIADNIEEPMAGRTPAYAALDLLLDWEGTLGGARIGAFLQVRNALNRSNAVTYLGSYGPCTASPPRVRQARPGVCDEFDRGIPLLPLAGVRIAF